MTSNMSGVPAAYASGITSKWPLPSECFLCAWVYGPDRRWHLKTRHGGCRLHGDGSVAWDTDQNLPVGMTTGYRTKDGPATADVAEEGGH